MKDGTFCCWKDDKLYLNLMKKLERYVEISYILNLVIFMV